MAKKKGDESITAEALHGMKLPILTIDVRWHELFPQHEKTNELRKLENLINQLLKEQGKLMNELKEMKKLKTTLMQNIVYNIDNGEDEASKKKIRQQERDQKMVMKIKEKTTTLEDRLLKIPYEIKETNEKLLIEGMRICYEKLRENKVIIEETEEWITNAREELKNRILDKQDRQMQNDLIYTTMHAIIGAKAIEIFDKDDRKKEEER